MTNSTHTGGGPFPQACEQALTPPQSYISPPNRGGWHVAQLAERDLVELRAVADEGGLAQQELADRFGVSRS